MLQFQCTAKAAKALGLRLETEPIDTAGTVLGNWYVNLVSGGFVIFCNARSLFSFVVAMEDQNADPFFTFSQRLFSALRVRGIGQTTIERVLSEYRDVRFSKTASRRVLGSMNDMAFHVEIYIDRYLAGDGVVRIGEIEDALNTTPYKALDYHLPKEVFVDLLSAGTIS